MEVKIFEIRDDMTFLVGIAIRLGSNGEAERYLLSRANYGKTMEQQRSYVYLIVPILQRSEDDPVMWGDRTIQTAHNHIIMNWNKLTSGQVIDAGYLVGDRAEPRKSQRLEV